MAHICAAAYARCWQSMSLRFIYRRLRSMLFSRWSASPLLTKIDAGRGGIKTMPLSRGSRPLPFDTMPDTPMPRVNARDDACRRHRADAKYGFVSMHRQAAFTFSR